MQPHRLKNLQKVKNLELMIIIISTNWNIQHTSLHIISQIGVVKDME